MSRSCRACVLAPARSAPRSFIADSEQQCRPENIARSSRRTCAAPHDTMGSIAQQMGARGGVTRRARARCLNAHFVYLVTHLLRSIHFDWEPLWRKFKNSCIEQNFYLFLNSRRRAIGMFDFLPLLLTIICIKYMYCIKPISNPLNIMMGISY